MTSQTTPEQAIADTLAVVDKTLDNIDPGTDYGDFGWTASDVRRMLNDLRTRLDSAAVQTLVQGGATEEQISAITPEEWASRTRTGTCSNPSCALTRAHSGPCDPARGATEEQIEAAVIACIESASIPTAMRADIVQRDGWPVIREQVDLTVVAEVMLEAALPVSASADPADEVPGYLKALIGELRTAPIEGHAWRRLLDRAADALAAPIEVDEAKLAEVIAESEYQRRPFETIAAAVARRAIERKDEWLRGDGR